MELGLLDYLQQFGLPMGLFIGLFIYTMKETKAREKAYQDRETTYQTVIKDSTAALTRLADSYNTLKQAVAEIKADVEDIKEKG